ncbi:MAG TPA: GH3 auxin-responsive promoter family protein [Vicinamibacterales bacterium]|nr:GH3 auxin-responsive promoter family protein [Vicinamibacterales bacterium]
MTPSIVKRHALAATTETMRRMMLITVGAQHRRFVAATADPRAAQAARLHRILRTNAATEYGVRYGFSSIRTIADFQTRVPIVTYDQVRPHIKKMMDGAPGVLTAERPYQYLLTSGSTNEPKYVPVTRSFRREYATPLQFYYLYRQHPDIFRPGGILSMVSPAIEGWTAAGVPYGAASGLTYLSQNALVRTLYAVPYDAFTIKDFAAKYYVILRMAVERDLRVILMANPSTLGLLLKELNQHAESLIQDIADGRITAPAPIDPDVRRRLASRLRPNPQRARELARIRDADGGTLPPVRVWPRLRAVVCWRDASAALYLPALEASLGDVPVYNLGYAASEGLGTFRLAGAGDEVLAITGHLFEFCDVDEIDGAVGSAGPLRLCDELEEGHRYFIVMTTSGGLYRYHIDDIVEVRGFVNRTPALRFVQKGTNSYSFTGEKLTEAQIIAAVTAATSAHGVTPTFFTALPIFGEPPHYRVMVEGPASGTSVPANLLAGAIDAELSRLNVEFEGKRKSRRLASTQVVFLPPGFFEQYREATHRTKRDAQIKFKHLNPDALFHETVAAFDTRSPVCG